MKKNNIVYGNSYVIRSPCEDCGDRYVNETTSCHTSCEEYKAYRDKIDLAKTKHYKHLDEIGFHKSVKKNIVNKSFRRQHDKMLNGK